jgi:hypothetical protein
MTITDQRGMDNNTVFEGIIGLAPDDPSNGPSIVNALYNANMIAKRVFGITLGTIDNFNSKS